MNKKVLLTFFLSVAVSLVALGQSKMVSLQSDNETYAKVFKEISLYAAELGVEFFTVYAFSTENWKRPKAEVNTLILLFEEYLKDAIEHFSQKNIRVRFWGDTSQFSQRLQNLIRTVEDNSADHTGMTLNICLCSYHWAVWCWFNR